MKTPPNVRLVLCLACSTAAFAALAIIPGATLFENDNVKVIRALERPHVKGNFHEHKMNRVMVYLQDGTQKFEFQDARKPVVSNWKAGQIDFSKPEGMHSPEVTTDEPFNIVEVELKKAAPATSASAPDPAKADAKHYKLELENDQVRVLRLKLGPHESTPAIRRAGNAVAIYLSDGNGHKAGDATWEVAKTEKLENAGDQPLEMVWIELRD